MLKRTAERGLRFLILSGTRRFRLLRRICLVLAGPRTIRRAMIGLAILSVAVQLVAQPSEDSAFALPMLGVFAFFDQQGRLNMLPAVMAHPLTAVLEFGLWIGILAVLLDLLGPLTGSVALPGQLIADLATIVELLALSYVLIDCTAPPPPPRRRRERTGVLARRPAPAGL